VAADGDFQLVVAKNAVKIHFFAIGLGDLSETPESIGAYRDALCLGTGRSSCPDRHDPHPCDPMLRCLHGRFPGFLLSCSPA
jgi:hypothetical protein